MRLEINRSLCGQSNEAVSRFFWVEVECQELVLISKPLVNETAKIYYLSRVSVKYFLWLLLLFV